MDGFLDGLVDGFLDGLADGFLDGLVERLLDGLSTYVTQNMEPNNSNRSSDQFMSERMN